MFQFQGACTRPGRTERSHMAIDCKFFPVFLHGKARRHAAQSGTRGAYRATGQGLGKGYTKPDPRHKYNSGAKGMHVLAGMGGMARFSCGSSSRDHGTAMKPSGCTRARCAEPSSAPTPTAADSISWKTTTLAGSRVRRGCGEEREQNQRLPHPAPLAGPEPL